ncbi:hypothetical protein BC829DRAFT_226272 [Chytridium lagenaria]|nr:hypothetical protein BC829DRAFT_226272 [Chytridium lagenaria]
MSNGLIFRSGISTDFSDAPIVFYGDDGMSISFPKVVMTIQLMLPIIHPLVGS